MKSKILIIGAGAIGSFYAAKLSQAGAYVTIVSRSDYDQVKANGIKVKSYQGDFDFKPDLVIKDAREYQDQFDFIIIATKVLPEINLPKIIKPILDFKNNSKTASIVLIQNGIHTEEEIVKAFPKQHLISAIAFIAVSKIGPGIIDHQAFGKIIIGDYPQGQTPKTKLLFDLFQQSHTSCQLSDNIKFERWKKLIWNIGFNPTSVLTGGRNTAQMLADLDTKALIVKIMQEVEILAAADNCPLPVDIVQKNIDDTLSMPPYKTSMLLDFEAKRKMEVEAILGNALRFAKLKKIAVPYISSFYGLLKQY